MNIVKNSNIKFMTVQEIKELYDKNEINLIDVREIEEWNTGHIPGAKFIPLSAFSITQIETFASSKKHLVLHCRSGRRCGIAAERMVNSGYKGQIIRMAGGILEWANKGYLITSQ